LGTGGHALRLSYSGEAYLLAGRMQKAGQLAERALDLSRTHKERGYEAWALRLLGEIAAHQDSPKIELAANHYRQARTLAEELGMRPLVAHCHLGLGKLSRRTGKREQVREHLTTATTMYREMGMTYWLEQADREMKEIPR
jgi:tetratricopeptide (TPR) repeat protein